MASIPNIKSCLHCNRPLHGRADKKYCDDACRNNYNNMQTKSKNNSSGNLFNVTTQNNQTNNQNVKDSTVWKLKCENGKSKNDVFQNLLSQLNGLEKLVKSAKKELSKYENQEVE